jgi:TonB-dependent SusC/RagA subfamily outer membrane receptor
VPQDDSALLTKALLMTLFCLFISIATFAQKKDTVSTDTAKRLIIVDASSPSKKAAQPLIILNGKIYKRNFKTIDTAKIESIRILKDKDAAQYGSKGKNGVILITTKH